MSLFADKLLSMASDPVLGTIGSTLLQASLSIAFPNAKSPFKNKDTQLP